MTLLWSDEDEDLTVQRPFHPLYLKYLSSYLPLLRVSQQVDSPSPVFPEERPVHRAGQQPASLTQLPEGSPGPSAPTRRYQSLTGEATLRFHLCSSALLCLW